MVKAEKRQDFDGNQCATNLWCLICTKYNYSIHTHASSCRKAVGKQNHDQQYIENFESTPKSMHRQNMHVLGHLLLLIN